MSEVPHVGRAYQYRTVEPSNGSNVNPTPYTQHPTPFTLHPTPYTLHLKRYILHPTPQTLHPSPFTLHHTPCTRAAAMDGGGPDDPEDETGHLHGERRVEEPRVPATFVGKAFDDVFKRHPSDVEQWSRAMAPMSSRGGLVLASLAWVLTVCPVYRGPSLIRNCFLLGSYSRP